MKYLSITIFLFYFLPSFGQDSLTIQSPLNILTEENLDDLQLNFTDQFKKGICRDAILSNNGFNNNARFRAQLQNQSNNLDFTLELDNYLIDSFAVHQFTETSIIKSQFLSEFSENKQTSFEFVIPKDSTHIFLIEIWNKPPYSLPLKLWQSDNYAESQVKKDFFQGVLFGVFILIILLSIIAYFLFKKTTYIYYGLYVFFTYLFYLTEFGYLNIYGFSALAFNEQFIFSIVILSSIFFLLFSYFLFEVRIKWFNHLYLGILGVSVLILLLINTPLLANNFGFKLIYNGFISFFLIAFVIGFFRVLISEVQPKKIKYLLAISYLILLLGIIIKPLCFLGLFDYGFLAKYGSIIGQNIELLILGVFLFSQQLESFRYTAELERKKLFYQNAALQAQMNPHFIFNSLNSIQSFIMHNEKEQAMDYLAKFAKLIRQTLKASSELKVSLDEEVQSLEHYLSLEQLRLDHNFDYSIDTSQLSKLSDIFIPPMLIQPFVENAVVHGMSSIEKDGVIQIKYWLEGENLWVKVFDNGKFGADQPRLKGHKSMGTSITNTRLSLVNKSSVKVIPQVTEEGTTVIIQIKLN